MKPLTLGCGECRTYPLRQFLMPPQAADSSAYLKGKSNASTVFVLFAFVCLFLLGTIFKATEPTSNSSV